MGSTEGLGRGLGGTRHLFELGGGAGRPVRAWVTPSRLSVRLICWLLCWQDTSLQVQEAPDCKL